MIDSSLISQSVTSGAGTMQYALTIVEPLQFGATQTVPQITTAISTGTPFVSGGNVIIPCKVTVTAKYINSNGVVYRIQEMNEDFVAGITGTTIPTSVVAVINPSMQTLRKTMCCKSYEVMIQASASLTLTAA